MKRNLQALLILALLSSILYGCGPAFVNSFAGTWTTNLGKVNFVQTGDEVTGVIEGYGGNWNNTFKGKINEYNEASFTTDWFGDFTIVLVENNTFKSKSSELSFCGIRSDKSEELPAGCGFSGKWIVPSKSVFLDRSYMILKQVGENVTGDLFSGNNKSYESIIGKVEWGKGWHMNGTFSQRGQVTFYINASETGLEFVYGDKPNTQQLCAVREGQASAYLGYFTCTP